MRASVSLSVLVFLSAPDYSLAQSHGHAKSTFVVDSAWVPVRIDRPRGGVAGADDQGPNVLHFGNGRQMPIQLCDVQFLGQLPRSGRVPILILGARGCHSCDIETQVYPVPADSTRYDYGKRGAYYYPGWLRPAEPPPDTAAFYHGR